MTHQSEITVYADCDLLLHSSWKRAFIRTQLESRWVTQNI